jgi:hypothetical protein
MVTFIVLVLALIGAAIVSMAIAGIIVHLLIKGTKALLSLSPQHNPNESSEYREEYDNQNTNPPNVPVHPYDLSAYDPYEMMKKAITAHRNKSFANQIGDSCPYQATDTNTNKYYGYSKCILQFRHIWATHLRGIVDRVRRRVNQSGKEPIES